MNYKDTINLPKTSFKMKANLSQKEPQMLNEWNKKKLYEKMVELRKGNKPFILHDGPPYANGDIHIGTAFNKVLKDFIVKYKTMRGFYSPYIPGWDCHGMPIEHKVTGQLGEKAKSLPKLAIREACRKYAAKYTKIQKDEFRRLGVTGDWEHPYLTMDYQYEGDIIRNFAQMVENGYIYRGLRPIHWCMKCKTALAEAEVEYKEHESHSIYVKFRMLDDMDEKPTYILIWTTTPWTLPANVAVAVHPEQKYVACEVNGEIFIFLETLKENIEDILNKKNLKVIKEIYGRELENSHYKHPFIDRTGPIVLADYVTTDTGTGCVHTAPGHGYEDYQTGLKYKLPILSPVDENGNYTDEFPMMKGMNVFDANDKIVELLKEKGFLLHEDKISHSYPHCWRCESPLIFRATKQWFLNVDHRDLRGKALGEIDKSEWIPSWSKDRIRNM
ncbi:class I tRNA ligase family protein, partial [candidate division WOR-3 bacterium]|nr:class I tRNA ligase family protein [candidate division WOR-3 bacterium]